jgi:hypothetical protein
LSVGWTIDHGRLQCKSRSRPTLYAFIHCGEVLGYAQSYFFVMKCFDMCLRYVLMMDSAHFNGK